MASDLARATAIRIEIDRLIKNWPNLEYGDDGILTIGYIIKTDDLTASLIGLFTQLHTLI